MIKTLKPFIALLAVGLNLTCLHAQDSDITDKSSDQNIIIHKKNSTKEKITVVIDGDNVTVNGKPVDDFKSNDVDIIKQDMDNHVFAFDDGGGVNAFIAPHPPMEMFKEDMTHNIKTNSAFLGVMTEKDEKGAKISEVTDTSAAEKAGLKEGDVITKIGDDNIREPNDVYKAIGKHKPGDKVAITYLRNGKQATANATLGKSDQMKVYSWNSPDAFNYNFNKSFGPGSFAFAWSDKPRLGISAQDTEDGNGVKIIDIDDDDSPAAKAGLKENDIITQVNGKAITSTDDLRQSVKDVKKGDSVKLTYKRNNETKTVDIKFPKELKTVDL